MRDIEVVLLVHEERRKAVHCNRTSPSFDDNRRRIGSPMHVAYVSKTNLIY